MPTTVKINNSYFVASILLVVLKLCQSSDVILRWHIPIKSLLESYLRSWRTIKEDCSHLCVTQLTPNRRDCRQTHWSIKSRGPSHFCRFPV